MAHIWVSHGAHMSESWRTYEWVISHIWVGHATYMNGSCHTYEWVMAHIWGSLVIHTAKVQLTRLPHMCAMTHSYVWHDPFIYVTWLMSFIQPMYSCGQITLDPSDFGSSRKQPMSIWRSPDTANCQQKQQIIPTKNWVFMLFNFKTKLPACFQHYRGPKLSVHSCSITRTMQETLEPLLMWMSHVTHMNESCHTYEWVAAHTWMSRVTHMNESCHTYERVMSHIRMSHVTHTNESYW